MARERTILLTPAEVAEMVRVSVKTVYRALWAKELKGTQVRGLWRISEAAVWQWIGVEAA